MFQKLFNVRSISLGIYIKQLIFAKIYYKELVLRKIQKITVYDKYFLQQF